MMGCFIGSILLKFTPACTVLAGDLPEHDPSVV